MCTQKPQKIDAWSFQFSPQTFPKPLKFDPGAPEDVQKLTKNQNKCRKKRKMLPRSAQEAPKSEK